VKIVVYTMVGCVYCEELKDFFKHNNISYKEKDIADDTVYQEMIEKSKQLKVPVMDIDGQIIIGFDEEELSKLFPPKADPPLAENNKKI